MLKFIITRITDTERVNWWAYLIDDTDECKWFFKHKYDIDIEKAHYGKWFVCTDEAQWICLPDKFVHYYRIVDVVKEEKTVTDFHGEVPSYSGVFDGECSCACATEEHTTKVSVPDLPVDICISHSKEHGFFMSINFKDDEKV